MKKTIIKDIIICLLLIIVCSLALFIVGKSNVNKTIISTYKHFFYSDLEKKADELCSGIIGLLGEGSEAHISISKENNAIDYDGRAYLSADGTEIEPQAWWVDDWKIVCLAIS